MAVGFPCGLETQDHPKEENPVYGTAKVLLAYRDWQRVEEPIAQRGFRWLREGQQEDGGWGGGPAMLEIAQYGRRSSVEETTLALEALLADTICIQSQEVVTKGLAWIIESVETDRFRGKLGRWFLLRKAVVS